VIAIYVLRAAALLSILPPLEGWDEYQHLARVAYLVENGRSPTLGESVVPRSLYPVLAALPHSRLGAEQLGGLGALPYRAVEAGDVRLASYWDGPPPALAPDAPSVSLYQAQHGPLYYWLMAPVFRMLWDSAHPLTCIYFLRWINVGIGAAAIVAVLWALTRLVSSERQRIWMALLLGVQPLFLLNAARIANDALAVCLGIMATAILLVHGRRGGPASMAIAGVLIGLAVLSKSVALVLLPLALVVPLVAWVRRDVGPRRAIAGVGSLFLAIMLVTGHYFYTNWNDYGVAVPMQESVINRKAGRGLGELAGAALTIDWWRQFRSRVGRDSLWVGGWSYLGQPDALRVIHQGLMACAVLGLGWMAVRGVRRPSAAASEADSRKLGTDRDHAGMWIDPAHAWLMALVVACSIAGLAYHTIQSKLAHGAATTNIWYAAICFPWAIVLYVLGVGVFRVRGLATAMIVSLIALCIVAEVYGLFVLMPREYTGVAGSEIARARLASVHPSWMPPVLAIPAQGLAIMLVMVVGRFALGRNSDSISGVAGG